VAAAAASALRSRCPPPPQSYRSGLAPSEISVAGRAWRRAAADSGEQQQTGGREIDCVQQQVLVFVRGRACGPRKAAQKSPDRGARANYGARERCAQVAWRPARHAIKATHTHLGEGSLHCSSTRLAATEHAKAMCYLRWVMLVLELVLVG
jgi:hypothetical protein